MKRIILKLAAIFLAVFVLIASFVLVAFKFAAPQYKNAYTAAIPKKIERLNSIEEPKIILIGNSNLAFGIDSSMLEEKFGMPVVNLGGHGGLGVAFHYNMARSGINEGDIVIICNTEYDKISITDKELAWITIENHDLFSLVPEEDYFDMMKALPKYAIKTVFLWLTGQGNEKSNTCYSVDCFNEYGDNTFPRPGMRNGI